MLKGGLYLKKQRGKFNATAIYKRIVEQREATIQEEASELNLSLEQFERMCTRAMGMQVFGKVKKMSQKIEKDRRKLEEATEPKEQEVKALTVVQSPENEESKRLANAYNMLSTLRKKVAELQSMEESYMEKIGANTGRIVEINHMIDEAKKEKERVEKENFDISQQLSAVRNEQILAEKRICNLQYKIEEIEGSVVYIISPNYQGEIPKGGLAISTNPPESDRNIRKEEPRDDDVLIVEPTFQDFLASSMETEEYEQGLLFARLCIKYATEQKKKVTILCDNPDWVKILEKQGLLVAKKAS